MDPKRRFLVVRITIRASVGTFVSQLREPTGPAVCRRSSGLGATFFVPFMRKLTELGYVEGRNLALERKSAEGNVERLNDLAAELVRDQVDLIVTAGTPAGFAAKKATSTIPIVIGANSDPVGVGLVRESLPPWRKSNGQLADGAGLEREAPGTAAHAGAGDFAVCDPFWCSNFKFS